MDTSADACAHCGKAAVKIVESVPPVAEAEKPAERSSGTAKIKDAVVDDEVQLARQYIKAGDNEVGLMFVANAAILNLLSDSSGDERRSSAITAMMAEYGGRGGMVRVKCTACDGTGTRIMKVSSLVPGEAQTREVQGSKCPSCQGAGTIRRAGNMDEKKFARGRAETRFETVQRGRKYQRIGGAWLPSDAAEALGVKDLARVRTASAPPCEECLGFGKTECKACGGTGILDCEACDSGNVFIKVTGELTKMTLSRSEKCKICGGRGVVLCAQCAGSGGILCRKCNGNGKQPECQKCAGQGYTSCKKCSGSGIVDDKLCDNCGGETVVLCPSCNGDGHK